MTDKEKKHLQEIQNVPVDEEKLRNDRKNAISFKQETTYELTLELMDIERKKAESSIDALEVKEVDLEKEIANQYESIYKDYLLYYEEFADIAKYFFKLGLKAQKGE